MKVLLLDPGWPQTGYLMTHLAAAGADVVRAASGPFDALGLGAYCRNVRIPDEGVHADWLVRLIDEEQPDFVLPLAEELQRVAWEIPQPQLARVFPAVSQAQCAALADRPTMYRLAAKAGIPVPLDLELPDEAAVDAAVAGFGLPLVIRGTQGLGGAQVKIVRTPEEARSARASLIGTSPGLPFAQPFLVGQRCLIGGLFDGGRMLQWFSQMTLEASPPPTGPSVLVQSFRDPKLTEYARRLFAEFGWTGLACAEFIRTEVGDFQFLEINPRPWAAIQAAHICGVPLLKSFSQFLLDAPRDNPGLNSEFRVNRRIHLFPQYLIHRIDADGAVRLRRLGQYLSCLSIAPWRHPRLMLHYFRTIVWALRTH